jgi:predicted dehydrogenase
MLKFAIIGTGGFGYSQAQVIQSFTNARVVAICGRDPEKVKKITAELNITRGYTDLEEMLGETDADVICITYPNKLHFPIFKEILKTGKHIILEKPAGIDSKEIKEMLSLSYGYKGKIVVDHDLRFNPVVIELKRQIDAGELGKIHNIQLIQYTNYKSDKKPYFCWMNTKAEAGGQVLMMGTHLIDLGRYLSGMPKLVSGKMIKQIINKQAYDLEGKAHIVDGEEQISANTLMNNNVSLSFFNTLYSFGYRSFEIRVIGTKGIAVFDEAAGLRVSHSNDELLQVVVINDHLPDINAGRSFVSRSFKFFIERFINDLESGSETKDFCSLQEAYENIQILERIDR